MKYYIDEPDVFGSTYPEPLLPRRGVRSDTKLYDNKEEAEIEAEKLTNKADIYFCVWEFDETKETIL